MLRYVVLPGCLVVGLGACAVSNPVPVASYDGRYSGSRHSNDPTACGIQTPTGTTSALIAQGRIALNLFGPNTKMEGTVGDDGQVRASGLWLAPHSFMAMTLLHGRITGTTLSGTASNARCVTEISLDRLAPVPSRPRPKPRRLPDGRTSGLVLPPEQLNVVEHP